ncbi:unnamed protein product [Peniophora sp. CBMAI 1063]|nr:unnamed protein product [Peniophora sp. CBMAI 1063]
MSVESQTPPLASEVGSVESLSLTTDSTLVSEDVGDNSTAVSDAIASASSSTGTAADSLSTLVDGEAASLDPVTHDNDPPPAGVEFCTCDSDAVPALAVSGAAAVGLAAANRVARGGVGLVGFGAQGVVKGSWAAATQASIGNVAKGSSFAKATSVGMGGPVPPIAAAASMLLVGGALGLAFSLGRWLSQKEGNFCSQCGKHLR